MQSRCRSHFYVRGPILLFYFERRLEPPLQNLLSRYFGWCIHIMNSSLDFKTAFFAVIFKTMSLYETATLTAECTRFLVVHHVICDRTLRSFAHSFDRPLHGDPAQAYKKKQKNKTKTEITLRLTQSTSFISTPKAAFVTLRCKSRLAIRSNFATSNHNLASQQNSEWTVLPPLRSRDTTPCPGQSLAKVNLWKRVWKHNEFHLGGTIADFKLPESRIILFTHCALSPAFLLYYFGPISSTPALLTPCFISPTYLPQRIRSGQSINQSFCH